MNVDLESLKSILESDGWQVSSLFAGHLFARLRYVSRQSALIWYVSESGEIKVEARPIGTGRIDAMVPFNDETFSEYVRIALIVFKENQQAIRLRYGLADPNAER